MTRKCAVCKGTNYKRMYSFFSAPKDPKIRKKWQAAIPIANYTVTDDTYICSKHFKSSDIITHWVSGVPPHVITIKYKKCRLRIGAVPCLNSEDNDDTSEIVMDDQADQHDEILGNEIDFLIPREKPAESITLHPRVTEVNFDNSYGKIDPPIKFEKYNDVVNQYDAHFNQTGYVGGNNSYKTYVLNNEQMQDSIDPVESERSNQSRNHFDYKYPQIHKVIGQTLVINEESRKNSTSKHDEKLQDARIDCDANPKGIILPHNVKLEQGVQGFTEELIIEEDDNATLQIEHLPDNSENNHDDVLKSKHRVMKTELGDNLLEALQYKAENTCEENLDSGLCDTMLFEDLLEIYTEVTLPQGWAFLVTSKGHTTTVVYLYMNMPTNNIPIVEKEVYIKSDMVMHCGVGSKEINPFVHNLIRNGRNNKVHALSDIEELIDELDQRYICEGGPNVQNFKDIESQLAYMDAMKWRHVGCPIIINNGSSKCSKCASLNSVIAGRKNINTRGLDFDIFRKRQKKIESLTRSLKKITERNQRLERIRQRFKHRLRLLSANSEKTIMDRITSSDMPEIQKLMIKECLKTSMFKNNVRYSETWIFLCLLLYVESPRMYRYMFVNNYMALPSMGTIRKYFNKIKTDRQFYNLFQQSVEPYQPVNQQDEEPP